MIMMAEMVVQILEQCVKFKPEGEEWGGKAYFGLYDGKRYMRMYIIGRDMPKYQRGPERGRRPPGSSKAE